MKTPTLKEQVAYLRAQLETEQQAHAATRKELAEALAVDGADPDGALDAANEEIATLRDDIKDAENEIAELKADKDRLETDLAAAEKERDDALGTIEDGANYEARFMIALEMLGMTEHEFEWSKRAADTLARMPELHLEARP